MRDSVKILSVLEPFSSFHQFLESRKLDITFLLRLECIQAAKFCSFVELFKKKVY